MKKIRFQISHFAKIASADIELPGITVVVGENNSGKSTVGKALYALCSVFRNLDARVRESNMTSLDEAFEHAGLYYPYRRMDGLRERLLDGSIEMDELKKRLERFFRHRFENSSSRVEYERYFVSQVRMLLSEVKKIRKITLSQFREAVVWDYFDKVFHSQVIPLFRNHGKTTLNLSNGEEVNVSFDSAVGTIHKVGKPDFKACYLNGPFVANLLNSNCSLEALEIYDRELTEELRELQSVSSDSAGVVGARKVSNRIKLKKLRKIFDEVIPGTIGKKGKGKLAVTMPGCGEPITFENLSSGLKSFVLLWHILDQGLISDGDVLILDEPEVHLHPEWQIVYAHLIVLLCKTFDLHILLTSHSVDFIHALSLYVRKYKSDARLRLYKSQPNANGSVMLKAVPGNDWERLFDSFVGTIDILSALRDSLPEETESGK